MNNVKLIDTVLLNQTTAAAQSSPRRRKNHNFHPTDEFPAHRLLNAVEPDSYIAPHRHLGPVMDETLIVLRGALGLFIFDAAGQIEQIAVLRPQGECVGADIPRGTWHAALALENGTLFFEAKAGPFVPLTTDERALWAPAEGGAAASEYLEKLRGLLKKEGL